MSQCLRCSKPCETSAVFCDECRSLLRNEFRQGSVSRSSDSGSAASAVGTRFIVSSSTSSLVAQGPNEDESQDDDLARYNTTPPSIAETPRSPGAPITPHPPTLDSFAYQDSAEQTMSRLSEAAQFISEVEPSNRRLPRASRLAPIRDISADIRRESTPLPKFSKMPANTGASEKVNASGPLPVARGDMPDFWPWLDNEVEEKENEDTWANSTDPLISRHIPNSVESARIEEEDIKRALAEGIPTSHNLRLIRPRRASSLRIVFAVLAILAALALIVDGILFSVLVVHPRRASTLPNSSAVEALTLSPSVVDVANNATPHVNVRIMNFTADHSVQLWHDVQEPVMTVSGSNMVTIGKDGSAEATLKVDDKWAVGFDQVYAEDITTHYIASAQLQVKKGNDSSRPAHLVMQDQNGNPVKSLDFGKIIEGFNKILPLTLENLGSGSITWSASSNQPWLLVAPGQGTFSQSQQIDVAVQSSSLKPGTLMGTLTLSSNVSTQPQIIPVTVTVSASIPGPVLAPAPAVLSFTTTDGLPAPSPLPLVLNNPGTRDLSWTLTIMTSASSPNQLALPHTPGISSNWLSVNQSSGTILKGSSQTIQVSVNSSSLLPGAYLGDLVFSSPGAVDGSSQTVAVSLTVQPHCGLVTNSGSLSFTAVQGTNPSNQSLGLNATASCAGEQISWKAALSSSFNWLSATPTSGTLTGTTSQFISIGANATGLPPKSYYGFIALTTQKSTQTVMVTLTVQPPPVPNAPVMSAAPLNLNFSNTQGQQNPQSQVVTITNTGGSTLNWSINVGTIASSWLNAAPSVGKVLPGQTMQLVVKVNTSGLSPGSYAGQITLNAQSPASGGGQVVSINLVVQPACTLTQPSSSSLAFSGVQNGFNPITQSLLITGTGNCAWPLTLTASASSAPWLNVQFPTGSIVKGSGQSVVFVVGVTMSGLVSGPPISANFTISATDSAGTVATGSPQKISASLTVLPPCTLVVAPGTLNFTAAQGQSLPASKSVQLKETGTCSRPVSWVATTGSAWLTLSPLAQDTGSGSALTVSVNSTVPAGTFTGIISLTATDSNGYTIGTFQTIDVTLVVSPTYSVSGTVIACSGPAPACTTSAPLPGATVTVFTGTNALVETATADASGNYILANLSPGSYTVTITGTDAGGVHYSATGIALPVVGNNTAGITLNVFPG